MLHKIVAEVPRLISENILNGATAYDLERIAEEFILNAGAKQHLKDTTDILMYFVFL